MYTTYELKQAGATTNIFAVEESLGSNFIGHIVKASGKFSAYNLLGDLVINAADTIDEAASTLLAHFNSIYGKAEGYPAGQAEVFFDGATGTAFVGAIYYDNEAETWRRISAGGAIAGSYASREEAFFALAKAA